MGNYTYTPNVYFLVVLFFTNYLRCHVEGRPQYLLESSLGPVEAREAEISQLQVQLARLCRFLGSQEDIFRFDVSVADVLFVHVVQSQ